MSVFIKEFSSMQLWMKVYVCSAYCESVCICLCNRRERVRRCHCYKILRVYISYLLNYYFCSLVLFIISEIYSVLQIDSCF